MPPSGVAAHLQCNASRVAHAIASKKVCYGAVGVSIMWIIKVSPGAPDTPDPQTGIFLQNGQKDDGTHSCVPKEGSGHIFALCPLCPRSISFKGCALGSLVQSKVNPVAERWQNTLLCHLIGCFCTFHEQSLQGSNPSILCESVPPMLDPWLYSNSKSPPTSSEHTWSLTQDNFGNNMDSIYLNCLVYLACFLCIRSLGPGNLGRLTGCSPASWPQLSRGQEAGEIWNLLGATWTERWTVATLMGGVRVIHLGQSHKCRSRHDKVSHHSTPAQEAGRP